MSALRVDTKSICEEGNMPKEMERALYMLQVGEKAWEAKNVGEVERAQEPDVVREVLAMEKVFSVNISFSTNGVGDLWDSAQATPKPLFQGGPIEDIATT
jgi:hypothetical protein